MNQAVKVGLTDRIILNLTYIVDYDSNPVDKPRKVGGRIKMGIGYQW
ncbi:hypothetical protein [Endozoicomonas sp. YOMI1]